MAGDVFDNGTPSNKAQELYFGFLRKLIRSSCRQAVIIGGNHDSPTFLNAPKAVLELLNVHVIGAMSDNPNDEIVVLKNFHNEPSAIVCAVPYLRDKDIRSVEAGETVEDKNRKLVDGIKKHYAEVCERAEKMRSEILNTAIGTANEATIPIIAMGHLFTQGGKCVEGDGVRELYVGSLAYVGEDAFPTCIDYLALGHLHVPQCVGKSVHYRYSGSPIPMGYGEVGQEKQVILLEFNGKTPIIETLPVPCFQSLEKIAGSAEGIQSRIQQLIKADTAVWLDIEYTDSAPPGNLKERIFEWTKETKLEVLRVRNRRTFDHTLSGQDETESLDDLDSGEVFNRCLHAHELSPEQCAVVLQCYSELMQAVHEKDVNAL